MKQKSKNPFRDTCAVLPTRNLLLLLAILLLVVVLGSLISLDHNNFLDRWANASDPNPTTALGQGGGSPLVLRVFPVLQGDPAALAAQLQQLAGNTTQARIAADPRTRQILVLAPADIQAQLAAQAARIPSLGQPFDPAATAGRGVVSVPPSDRQGLPQTAGPAQQSLQPGQNKLPSHPLQQGTGTVMAAGADSAQIPAVQVPVSPATMAPPMSGTVAGGNGPGTALAVSHQVPLRQKRADQLEATLIQLLGPRLRLLSSPDGGRAETVRYALPVASDGTVYFTVNRRTNQVVIQGPPRAAGSAVQLVQLLDVPPAGNNEQVSLMFLQSTRPTDIERTIRALQATEAPGAVESAQLAVPKLVSAQMPAKAEAESVQSAEQQVPTSGAQPPQTQPGDSQQSLTPSPASQSASQPAVQQPSMGVGTQQPAQAQEQPPVQQPTEAPPQPQEQPAPEAGTLIGPVQIELLEGLDVLVIRGHPRDVQRVVDLINQIEQLSVETRPVIQVYFLHHVQSEALAELLEELYQEVFAARLGNVSITALVKPNALLLIGRQESVETVVELIKKLDRPVAPETQFRVFRLKNAPAETVRETLEEFYADRGGLGTRIRISTDFRSNSLLVEASPRDMAEIAEVVARLDAGVTEAVHELKVFKLKNALATELAPIVQSAITGTAYGQQAVAGAAPAAAAGQAERKSVMLRFVTIDPKGQQVINSGIVTDVQVTADARSNSLLVSAPPESMPLMEALIRELDELPTAEAQVKVFTLVNADAQAMMEMLQTIFGQQVAAQQVAVRTGAQEGESTLVPLRFAVDVRTNSIIASGSAGDLALVEAILLRLDTTEVRNRISEVYRLKNAPATDVANALNEFLRSERQLEQLAPGLVSAFEQIEREVVIVPEPVSNALIVSATPRFFEDVMRLVEKLDERPPMVMIQVLIAEVTLNNTDEFGVELGLQDSILFDRSVAGTGDLAGQNIPGFLFNTTDPLGNSNSPDALAKSDLIGTQGITNFSVGRANAELGFGGLVLSASSESVSVLIRALKECRRIDVLSRPQVMTMDNQTAEIIVGEEVPFIAGTQFTDLGGQINTIQYREAGLVLTVTPRISPDRLVVMEIDATKSEVGPEAEGIPVSVSQGQVIRSPRIKTTSARTVVSAMDGQTVVLGGLITKSTNKVERKVPFLGDIPLVGRLFRYDLDTVQRKELLIIMTPHIVENADDAERIKQIESARIDWCLRDVLEIHGGEGLESKRTSSLLPTTIRYRGSETEPEIIEQPELEPIPTPAPEAAPLNEGAMGPGILVPEPAASQNVLVEPLPN